MPPSLFIYYTLMKHTYNILYMQFVECRYYFLHSFRSVEGLPWDAEPRFELGPALQQADAQLSEPRSTLKVRSGFPLISRFFSSEKLIAGFRNIL